MSQYARQPQRHQKARRSASQCQEGALRKQLSNELNFSRTQCEPDRDFLPAQYSSHKKKAGQVDAAYKQEEPGQNLKKPGEACQVLHRSMNALIQRSHRYDAARVHPGFSLYLSLTHHDGRLGLFD